MARLSTASLTKSCTPFSTSKGSGGGGKVLVFADDDDVAHGFSLFCADETLLGCCLFPATPQQAVGGLHIFDMQ